MRGTDVVERIALAGSFLRHLARKFREDRCLGTAAELTYISLLAIVPVMAVILAVLSAVPAGREMLAQLQAFVFRQFVPTAGDTVRAWLEGFAEKGARLTVTGVAALAVIVLLAMGTIERGFQRIWRVRRARPLAARLAVYWALLTLGPLLLGAGIAATSYVASLPLVAAATGRLPGHILWADVVAWASSFLAFYLLYQVVPARRVRPRHALSGAIVATILFEVAKKAFTWWVVHVPTYERIYGALVTVPLFIVWIDLSWSIALLGAEVASALAFFVPGAAGEDGPEWRLVRLARLLGHLRRAQRRGAVLRLADYPCREEGIPPDRVEELLALLEAREIVRPVEGGGWILARDLDDLPMGELLDAAGSGLPGPAASPPGNSPWDGALTAWCGEARSRLAELLAVPVSAVLEAAQGSGPGEEGGEPPRLPGAGDGRPGPGRSRSPGTGDGPDPVAGDSSRPDRGVTNRPRPPSPGAGPGPVSGG